MYQDFDGNELRKGMMVELLPDETYGEFSTWNQDSIRHDGVRFIVSSVHGGRRTYGATLGLIDNAKGGLFTGTRRIGIPDDKSARRRGIDRVIRRTVPVFMLPKGLITFVDSRGRPIPADARLPLRIKTG